MTSQTWTMTIDALVLVMVTLGWVNIKRLQIGQHRKWMMRTWFYASSTITARIIMIISANIVSAIGQYFIVWNCDELLYTMDNNSVQLVETFLPILLGLSSRFMSRVEIYIRLTPGETARLRKVSYQKQLERSMKYPGSMGTVGDKLGDNFGVAYSPE
ncbi:hypothetical protein FRC11_005557 [Ceratobasidium sp. 423]|nr:hypothetical protein FRC11_005557 [Ceratobasidium sp. 423]